MSRKISTNWAIWDKITAERLQELNQELDNLYANGDDIGRVTPALSGTALHVDIGGFPYSVHGNYWIYAWVTDLAIADNSTKYIQINSSWVISQDNARDTDKGLIAIVVTSWWVIMSITNFKSAFFGGYSGTGDMNWPSSSIDEEILIADWLTGKLAKWSGKNLSTDWTFTSNSDNKVPTEKAIKTFVDNEAMLALYFWDGSDWDVTITTTVTLSRDTYYNNLTINSPWILNPNWYRFFVKWILSGNGKIQRNGNAWTAWADNDPNSVWGAWWVVLNQWSLNADVWGSNWWMVNYYWWTWRTPNGTTWTSTNPSYTNITGANWWNGGTSTWPWAPSPWTWGGWWTSTRWSLYNVGWNPFNRLFRACWPASFVVPTFTQYKTSAWSWWGGGGSSWHYQWYGGCWWGGGGNGGFIWASINIINRTWTWESKWGNWWNGGNANPTYQATSSAWWGGGGWSGGTIYLLYRTLTSMWTETLTWWTKWSPGSIWVQPSVFAQDWPTWTSIKIAV